MIAVFFGPCASDILTVHVTFFSHYFKRLDRFGKLATSFLSGREGLLMRHSHWAALVCAAALLGINGYGTYSEAGEVRRNEPGENVRIKVDGGSASASDAAAVSSDQLLAMDGTTTPAPTSTQMSASSRSTADMVARVKADLAAYLGVSVDDIGLVDAVERSWPDRGLGCHGRSRVLEPRPAPGYLITLQHDRRTYPYHTDQADRFIRCLDPGKRIDPIIR